MALQDVCSGASEAQRAIRASRAVQAQRQGLDGDHASFHQWAAWKRGAGPARRDLEMLSVAEAILWQAYCDLAPAED